MMTLVFWQNIISPHQYPYIREIQNIDPSLKVILVVQEDISLNRKNMGWSVDRSDNNSVDIIIKPSNKQISSILKRNRNSYHFFSGIRSYPMVFAAFRESIQYPKIKRYLIVEGPNFYKGPKILHFLKIKFLEKKYFRYVDKVFAIGHHAREWYSKFGFSSNQIVPFTYCVERDPMFKNILSNKSQVNFVYVGSIIKRKNLAFLLFAMSKVKDPIFNLAIIGDGPELNLIKKIVQKYELNQKVNFLGSLDNSQIRRELYNYDVLMLPSLHDGWGAVINEGLMAGLFVVCSDQCGGKDLIIDNFNGKIFRIGDTSHLKSVLSYCIENILKIRENKNKIQSWSKCLDGSSVAEYLLQNILDDDPITPPWKLPAKTIIK